MKSIKIFNCRAFIPFVPFVGKVFLMPFLILGESLTLLRFIIVICSNISVALGL